MGIDRYIKNRAAAFIMCLFVGIMAAQGMILRGTVSDGEDPMPGALVELCGSDSVPVATAVTDTDGRFSITHDLTGKSLLKISMPGFRSSVLPVPENSENVEIGIVQLIGNSVELNEVAVTAKGVINGANHYTVFPREELLKNSSSSLNVLAGLSLPGLEVNPVLQTASVNGKPIVYQINGVPKSLNQILAIDPDKISKVLYSDNPSIKYEEQGVGGIINIVLNDRANGGTIYQNLMSALTCGMVNNTSRVSLNHGKSEFDVEYALNYRDYTHNDVDRSESYLATADKLTRNYIGRGKMNYANHDLSASYTYIPTMATLLSATLRWDIHHNEWRTWSVNRDVMNGIETTSSQNDRSIKVPSSTPSLDIYFRHEFRDKSILEANAVGTYLYAKSDWMQQFDYATDVDKFVNNVINKKKSIIAEISWEKPFSGITTRFGARDTYNSSNNTYTTATNEDRTRLKSNNLYIYGEASGKICKWFSYSIGTGLRCFHVKDNKNSVSYSRNLTKLNAKIGSFGGFAINASASYGPQLPAISNMDNTSQTIDEYNIRRGNPSLKPAQSLLGRLILSYQPNDLFTTYLRTSAQRLWDPMVSSVSYSDGYYVTETVNASRYIHYSINWDLVFTLDFAENVYMQIKATPSFNRYVMAYYPFYRHTLNDWAISGEISFMYNQWGFFASVEPSHSSLYGETISYTGPYTGIQVNWRWNDFTFNASYNWIAYRKGSTQKSRSLSAINPTCYYSRITDNANAVMVGVVYRLNFGEKYDKKMRKLKNSDTSKSAYMLD